MNDTKAIKEIKEIKESAEHSDLTGFASVLTNTVIAQGDAAQKAHAEVLRKSLAIERMHARLGGTY